MLDVHAIAHTRASAILLFAHDAATAVDTTANYVRNGCSILQLALVLAVVLASLIIIVLFLLFFDIFAIVIAHVVIALNEALSFTLASSQIAVLLLLAIRQHDHISLKLTVLFDGFQKLKRIKDFKLAINSYIAKWIQIKKLTSLSATSSLGKTFC